MALYLKLERYAGYMIKDYSVYELSGKEKLLFYSAGYACIFIITYLFYHSLWLSVPAGAAVHWIEPYFSRRMAQRWDE